MVDTQRLLQLVLVVLLLSPQVVLSQTPLPVPKTQPPTQSSDQKTPPSPAPNAPTSPQTGNDEGEIKASASLSFNISASLDVNLDENQENQAESQNESEQTEPEPEVDPEQAEQEADSVVPKTEQNPFAQPNIDKLIQQQFNEDMWRVMRGGLPCLETSAACLQQLQDLAVAQSPLLKEIDTRIAEANERVNEAKARNQRSIKLSILTPALQYLLGPTAQPGQPQSRGFLDNIAGIFRGDTGIINALLNVVGVPLFQGISGGNEQAQQRAILISDIQVKIAELQRGRAELAEKTREKVAIALIKFDEARTDFQTSQIVASRVFQQFQIYELRYVRGNSDTESYLARQNQMDNTKATVYGSWAKMRRSLFEIKLLVLSVKDAEI